MQVPGQHMAARHRFRLMAQAEGSQIEKVVPANTDVHARRMPIMVTHHGLNRQSRMLGQPLRKQLQKRLAGRRPVMEEIAQHDQPPGAECFYQVAEPLQIVATLTARYSEPTATHQCGLAKVRVRHQQGGFGGIEQGALTM